MLACNLTYRAILHVDFVFKILNGVLRIDIQKYMKGFSLQFDL